MSKRTPPELGQALQSLRKSQKLTLDKLAEASGISKSMLSQIERGQTNPTFATLWSLTNALGVEIADILEQSETDQNTPVLIEHLEAHFTPTIKSPDGKCSLKILSPVSSVSTLEWYEMRVQKGGSLESAAHTNGTVEHLSLLKGTMTVRSNESDIPVKEGETVRYRGDFPHSIRNDSDEEAIAILVMDTPA